MTPQLTRLGAIKEEAHALHGAPGPGEWRKALWG